MIAAQLTWYLTRGSGAVALILLSLSAVLGMVVTIGWANDRLTLLVLNGLHRNLSLLVVVFTVVHVATTVMDSFVDISLVNTIVPFATDYRRVWVGFGTVALDLVIALVVTSLMRLRVPATTWRFVHWLSYACLPIAVVHALGTGSDVQSHLVVWLASVCGAMVIGTFVWRLAARRLPDPRATAFAVTMAIAVPIAIGAWAVSGPLGEDWSSNASSVSAVVAGSPATAGAVG